MPDKRAARIHRVIAALSHRVTAEEVADALVREVACTLDAQAARVGLFGEDRSFQIVSSVGLPPELTARWASRRVGDSPLMQAVFLGEPVFTPLNREDARADPLILVHFGADAASFVVPLAVAGKVIGYISAFFDHPRAFDEEERDFILTLASHCGQSLERARLFEAERAARAAADTARRELEAVLNQLPVAVVVVDRAGQMLLNERVRSFYGTTMHNANVSEYRGRTTHLDGSALKEAELPIPRAFRGESTAGELLQVARSDGAVLTVTVNAGPVRDQSGAITSAVAAFSDVTEELRVANELRTSERRYHAVLRATSDVIWEYVPETGRVEWNATLERVFGHSPREAARGGVEWWLGHLHPDDVADANRSFLEARESGAALWSGEYRFRCADGRYLNTLDRCVFERDEQGKLIRVVGAMSDITERQHLLNELRNAVSTRDDFLSIASHELRNPLAALSAQLLGLEILPLDDAKRGQKLAAATRQVRRLSALVDELLNVSRIVHGTLRLERESIDLSRIVADAAERLSDDFARGGTALAVDAGAPVMGMWDRLRLDLVVSNLLGNALRYGRKQPVSIRVEGDADCARVIVEDHGIGIRAEDQSRIFDRFVRAVPAREYGGLGVGLWLSRQIVDAHEGRLMVESQEGAGSRFTVELPK